MLFVYGGKANRYSINVMLAASCILWLARVILQVIYPQGSLYPGLQYGMLAAFIFIVLWIHCITTLRFEAFVM
jgi:hypothetical protein